MTFDTITRARGEFESAESCAAPTASPRLILTAASPAETIERLAGNKGRSLHRLANLGVAVPHWAILGTDCFAEFRRDGGLDQTIAALLRDFTPANAAAIASAIREAVLTCDISAALRADIARARDIIGDRPLAVRSSGIEEDSASFSFAGQFDTFLDVRGLDSTLEHVRRCWASAYSERSLRYRHQHGLDIAGAGMAVILQRLVQADTSGVVFTINPANGNRDELVLSAVYGLGEGLVSGAVDADTITVDRHTGQPRQVVIGEKHERHDGRHIREVPAALRNAAALSNDEIERVVAAARTLESELGEPLDIEWCIAEHQLWILQARPVTTPIAPAPSRSGEFQLWDNSNIVENYPGVTTQLTFTFAQHVYAQVFREFCRLLAIPHKQRREMDGFLGSTLAFLNGRVYYNLLHWYKLSGLAPFQNLGRKMMEVQMGVDEPLDLASFAALIAPYKTGSRAGLACIRALSSTKFAWHFARLARNVERFRAFFYPVYDEFNALDYRSLPADAVYAHYCRFEQALLARWGMMIVLESAIGLSYGVVRRLIKRWMPGAPDWLEVAVIGGMDDIESIEPVRRLSAIAQAVRAKPQVEALIRNTPSAVAYAALRGCGAPEIVADIERYLADFAYRSNNELKLEEPDLREDPGVLFDMLKAALAHGAASIDRSATEAHIDALLRERLNPLQRWIFARARGRVRAAIRARETVRFCRSRAFGVARRMFRAIGEGLAADGVLATGRDIFHLRLEEIRGCFEGTVSHRELRPLIEQRKRDDASYRDMADLPPRFVTHGPVAAWLSNPANLAALRAAPAHAAGATLRGTPCSPGFAEGRAKVVREANEFDGGILVTYRTDPGWVPVFASATGLLIERGSPLTHAAIVAREIGIPTVVQIPGLTTRVQSGMQLKVDGHSGVIELPEPT
ncbi:phosphoenolpyruvate synthase [Paraburkholderia sp. Cpub6]|uniref:phosphoenolpyruvate synthase n=1 Tax=Paraburkholderia sp. Cpub6 TaxID=2723094 RepID=UPI0016090A4D|nr:phosphoenolpyruvate synthase [Paraburkholderia sp. Cpub6]MBB5460881.1 pyruvate,water dikinase [Paraburkholderia sp. Cpub6]